MTTADKFEKIRTLARKDAAFTKDLLASRNARDPLKAFCKSCLDRGILLSPMEVISFGEESYAVMRRSTNGGGENSPLLEWEDDYYELLMAELQGY